MSLVQDVPGELKEFARVFDKLCSRHGDYGRCFSDFIDLWTGGMLVYGDPELADRMKKQYGKDYELFFDLQREMIFAYNRKIYNDGCWYDGFGLFYETIASRYKSSYLGQFFTPASISNLMAELTQPKDAKTVMDCCSGSGRLMLSAKIICPTAKFYACDVDPVCAKMTALNMALHGCMGEASCMDTLRMDWKYGYRINPYLGLPGINPIPHLLPINGFENSMFFFKTPEVKVAIEKVNKHGQFALF